jgi:hypothetical protein
MPDIILILLISEGMKLFTMLKKSMAKIMSLKL